MSVFALLIINVYCATCKIRHHVSTTFDARIRKVNCKNKNVLEVLVQVIRTHSYSRHLQFLKNVYCVKRNVNFEKKIYNIVLPSAVEGTFVGSAVKYIVVCNIIVK